MRKSQALSLMVVGIVLVALVSCGGGGSVSSAPATPATPGTPSTTPTVVSISPTGTTGGTTPDCGAAWLSSLEKLSKMSPTQKIDNIEIVSWNDYESGSQIEAGIDNCVSIDPTITGTTLTWTALGNTATVDHYSVFASADGENLTSVATIPVTSTSVDIAKLTLPSSSEYTFFVQAVGKPSVLNKVSPPVRYKKDTAPPPNQPPVAVLSVSPSSGTAPLTVTASTSGSTDPDGTIATTTIDFGDGTDTNAASASHTYNSAGAFTITATVTDNAGASAAADPKSVTVIAPAPPSSAIQIAVTPANVTANGTTSSAEYVYPGATRSFFSWVTGSSNVLVNWTASCGTPSSASGVTYFDWTAPATAGDCTITATSQADASKLASSTVTVLPEKVTVNVMPFYLVLYKGQYADLQSYVSGTSTANSDVTWTITGPSQGTTIGSATDRDLAWYSDVPGTYTLTATSARDKAAKGSATVIVTNNPMPGVTANGTQPVDCTCVGSGRCVDIGGNGSKYNAIGDWFAAGNTLASGDTLRLWNKGSAYHEQLIIGGIYSPTQPVRVCGVPDSSGNLPEINGANATAANPKDPNWAPGTYTMQQYGLLVVRNTNYYSAPPQYVVIEGLKINQAQSGDSYIPIDTGTPKLYSSSTGASCIRVQNGQDIVIRGNEIAKCGQWGIFTNAQVPEGKMVRRLTIEGNYLHDNATPNNYSMHNAYIQSDGAVIQFNYFGHAVAGATGSTLKTRAAGLYVRYNHLLAEQRLLDFVEPQDPGPYFYTYVFRGQNSPDPNDKTPLSTVASTEEHLSNVYAYGNTLWTGNGYCQNCVHYGFDMLPAQAQGGTMWFYHNTMQASFTSSVYGWTLWDDGKNDDSTPRPTFPHAQILNNIIARNPAPAKGAATFFQWAASTGAIGSFGKNWIDSNWGTGNSTPGFGNNCAKAPTGHTWQNPPGRCNLTNVDSAHLVQSGTSAIDSTTYAPNSGSGAIGTAQSLPTGIDILPPKFSLLPSTVAVTPRPSVADLGSIAAK